eukprot:tig00001049_g6653.t1
MWTHMRRARPPGAKVLYGYELALPVADEVLQFAEQRGISVSIDPKNVAHCSSGPGAAIVSGPLTHGTRAIRFTVSGAPRFLVGVVRPGDVPVNGLPTESLEHWFTTTEQAGERAADYTGRLFPHNHKTFATCSFNAEDDRPWVELHIHTGPYGAPSPSDIILQGKVAPQKELHKNVTCDVCATNKSIEGPRFKCSKCSNFDLCQPCHVAKMHTQHIAYRCKPARDGFVLCFILHTGNRVELLGESLDLGSDPMYRLLDQEHVQLHSCSCGGCACSVCFCFCLRSRFGMEPTEHGAFEQHCVNGKLLLELSDAELRDDLGITSSLKRKRLLMEISHLSKSAALRRAPPLPAGYEYHAFITYRRTEGRNLLANLVKSELDKYGYSVFFDLESLQGCVFDSKIFCSLRRSCCDIFVLSPGTLDRCLTDTAPTAALSNDWVRKEIAEACRMKKAIIPLVDDPKQRFPTCDGLPSDMAAFPRHNAIFFVPTLQQEIIARLCRHIDDAVARTIPFEQLPAALQDDCGGGCCRNHDHGDDHGDGEEDGEGSDEKGGEEVQDVLHGRGKRGAGAEGAAGVTRVQNGRDPARPGAFQNLQVGQTVEVPAILFGARPAWAARTAARCSCVSPRWQPAWRRGRQLRELEALEVLEALVLTESVWASLLDRWMISAPGPVAEVNMRNDPALTRRAAAAEACRRPWPPLPATAPPVSTPRGAGRGMETGALGSELLRQHLLFKALLFATAAQGDSVRAVAASRTRAPMSTPPSTATSSPTVVQPWPIAGDRGPHLGGGPASAAGRMR